MLFRNLIRWLNCISLFEKFLSNWTLMQSSWCKLPLHLSCIWYCIRPIIEIAHTKIWKNLKNWPFHIPKILKLILHKLKHRKSLTWTRPTKIVCEATIRTPLVTSINYLCLFYVACNLKSSLHYCNSLKACDFFVCLNMCAKYFTGLKRNEIFANNYTCC